MPRPYVLRIGPIDQAPPAERYLYVPVINEVVLDNLIFAPDDEAGLTRVRLALGREDLVCHPVLTDAARLLGLKIEEPDLLLKELCAELALSIGSEDLLPATRPLIMRRLFLRGLGAFSRSFVWDMMAVGAPAKAHVKGQIAHAQVDVMLGLQLGDSGFAIRTLFEGSDALVNAGLANRTFLMKVEPAYVIGCLIEAYGLRFRPALDAMPVTVTQEALSQFYAAIGQALHSLGLLPPGDNFIRTTLDQEGAKLSTEAELGAIPNDE